MTVLRLGDRSVRFRPRALLVSAGLALLACAVAVVSIGTGDYPMSPGQVVAALFGGGGELDGFIVTELRLPRVATALLAGAALALSGAIVQSLVRNPLGSPDILGVTQGASVGALAVIVLAGGGSIALAAGALAGGLAAGLVIFAIAGRGSAYGYRLVLVGIGLAAILTGVVGYLLTKARIIEASRAALWLTGSLDGRDWPEALPVLAVLLAAAPVLIACTPAVRAMEMGDESAAGLGVPVERVRRTLLVIAVLLASIAAAAAGPVAFVALTAPHLARRLTRTAGPGLLAAMCMGSVLLVTADFAAQHAFGDRQVPVGAVTGVLGGGYLVWLLVWERRRGRV